MSDSNAVSSGDDAGLGLQVIANSIVLASFVSQVVILVTFIPDLQVFPTSLRVLSLVTVGFSMLSALAVFLSNNVACNPATGIGCTLYLIGSLGKWSTYAMRIWLLNYKRNLLLLALMVTAVLVAGSSFQWWCALVTANRVLPRLCGPVTDPNWGFTDPLTSTTGAALNLMFIGLHVYYMWDYFRDAVQGTKQYSDPNSSQNTRFLATLRLFASSLLVMLWDLIQYGLRRTISNNPFVFFSFIYGGQILGDIIYCGYMRRFANDLHRRERMHVTPPVPLSPPSTHARHPRERDGIGMVGPDYIAMDGNRSSSSTQYHPSNGRPSPGDIPAPFPSRELNGHKY